MKNGFGNSRSTASTLKPRAKPLKRPTQARAIFTVEAIYEAFVRIWRRDGWSGLTTRSVALEAGVAIGTLYDYFPSKEALLSGYVRHCVEQLLQRLDEQVIRPSDLDWRTRINRLLRLGYDPADAQQPLLDYELLMLEHQIAEPKHHHRVFQELSRKWHEAFAVCSDLPEKPSATSIDAWLIMAWGGRRYGITLQSPAAQTADWLTELEAMICERLTSAG